MALARLQLRHATPGDPQAADRAIRVLCGICGLPYPQGWRRARRPPAAAGLGGGSALMDPAKRRGAAITIHTWLTEVESLRVDLTSSPAAWLAYPTAQEALRHLQDLEATLDAWADAVRAGPPADPAPE